VKLAKKIFINKETYLFMFIDNWWWTLDKSAVQSHIL